MRKGGESKISFCHPKDLRASTHTYRKPGGIKFWDLVEDSNTGCPSSVTVRMEYFFSFNPDIVNFVRKTDEGEVKNIVLLIFVLWWCFNHQWMRGREVGQNVLFRASRNRIFFQPESNKHDTFWHVVWTGYFYVLWAIAVSDFCLLEIYKNFCLPVSTITFTVNSHTDNCLYKYICFNYYKVSNQSFLLKYTLRVFIFIKTMVYRKNSL